MTKDEAITQIRNWDFLNEKEKEAIETLIPELKETEDMKLSREIKKFLVDFNNGSYSKPKEDKINAWLSWIDLKTDKQELYDESLFKPKDWVIVDFPSPYSNEKIICYIIAVHKEDYEVECNGICQFLSKKLVDKFGKIWSIFDAKPGDILMGRNSIFIFKNIIDDRVYRYCLLNLEDSSLCTYHIDCSNHFSHINACFSPTTKNQQELFFQRMKDDDYEWDPKKLELVKCDKKNMEEESDSEYKFKEGDWILYEDNDLREILKVTCQPDNEYICDNLNGENRYLCVEDANEYKFWTINDIKPGDVIVWKENHELTCIALIKNITYNYLKNEGKVELWFSYYTDGSWKAWNETSSFTNVSSLIAYNAKPANKRERDLLFNKLAGAGYKWNGKKLEFKNIGEKTKWSEEDDKYIDKFDNLCYENQKDFSFDSPMYKELSKMREWLKSIKQKIEK